MRVGILGVSHWHAGHHAAAIREAGAELAGVWDDDPAIAAGVAAKEGGRVFAGLEEALRCDLLCVLGRGPRAASLVGELLAQGGPPLLVDKPLGVSGADVAPLVAAAERAGRFVAVALPSRSAGTLQEVGRLRAADGMLGVVEAGYSVADAKAGFTAWRVDALGASLWDDGARLLVSTEAGSEVRPVVAQPRRYGAFLGEVMACVREGRAAPVSLRDFWRASVLIDEAYGRK